MTKGKKTNLKKILGSQISLSNLLFALVPFLKFLKNTTDVTRIEIKMMFLLIVLFHASMFYFEIRTSH